MKRADRQEKILTELIRQLFLNDFRDSLNQIPVDISGICRLGTGKNGVSKVFAGIGGT